MKEYIAKTGGRYTYNDDLLNLQELAMSMTAIFDGCSNFIVSGCIVANGRISSGYVWINGRVRYFEGAVNPTFPYYIYEKNNYETITYAGDVNKHGRCNYLSAGSSTIPQVNDEVSGQLPGYIEVKEDYAPRFIDKFVGRYAVLLDSPFARQTVKKDLALTGSLSVDKEIESKAGMSVSDSLKNYSLRGILKESGGASVGLYHQGQLMNEIEITTDGAFTFYRQGTALLTVDSTGIKADNVYSAISDFGSIRIESNNIYNNSNNTDDGEIKVNRYGYKAGNTRYRNFIVFDGRTANPLFSVEGKTSSVAVNGGFTVSNGNNGLILKNPTYLKSEQLLTSMLQWQDKEGERIGYIGYAGSDSLDLTLRNDIGNIIIGSKGFIDVRGELRVGGVSLADTYVSLTDFGAELSRKVDKIAGKGLSTEDFTTEYRNKLDSILTGALSAEGEGFVTAKDVADALRTKLNVGSNLSDLGNIAQARTNIEVYSKTEGDDRYLRTKNYLSEITALTSAEVEGKSPEQIISLKESRQQTARDNIAAEKKGTGDEKLAKTSNLSDLSDKAKARQNMSVYSISEIDSMLSGKLGSDEAYSGLPFTAELKAKLDAIKTGVFAGTIVDGVSQSQVEGYVMTSAVVAQLALKAPKLLDGYSAADKATLATNINVYSKTDGDARYGKLSSSFQDYITYLVGTGQTTANSQKTLRDKIDAPGKSDLDLYLKKASLLSDLPITSDTQRKQVCTTIGAAFASEYQTKLTDTGWLPCSGSNAGTLFARQIGNVVCIQGTINTGKKTSYNWGECAIIPNTISPPKYGCRTTCADFNDDHKYNRGCSFKIQAGSRTIQIHEQGMNNVLTELHFSYMT